MSLASKLTHEFAARIRSRGLQYFHQQAVEVLEHSPDAVEAIVHGSQNYRVRMALAHGRFLAACTCPHFTDGNECKHVWATILETDKNHYLSKADEFNRLRFSFDFGAAHQLKEREVTEPDFEINSPSQTNLPNSVSAGVLTHAIKTETKSITRQPQWKKQFQQLSSSIHATIPVGSHSWPAGRQIIYVIDAQSSRTSGRLTLDLGYRERTRKGEWSKFKQKRIPLNAIPKLKDQEDVQILSLLHGATEHFYQYSYLYESLFNHCSLSTESAMLLVPLMCATGRCFLRTAYGADISPIQWDDAQWEFVLKLRPKNSDEFELQTVLRQANTELNPASALLLVDSFVIGPDLRVRQMSSRGAQAWTNALKEIEGLAIPATDVDDLLEQVLLLPNIPKLELPAELQYQQVLARPIPHLVVRRSLDSYDFRAQRNTRLEADLAWNYEGSKIEFSDPRDGIYERTSRRYMLRDRAAEESAVELLLSLGFKQFSTEFDETLPFGITPKNLPHAVKTLLDQEWRVEAEGRLYRQPGSMTMSVTSNIDWFELHGDLDFEEGLVAKLPQLLSSLRRGESMVQLGDGSFGLLPDEWLKKYGLLTSLGETTEDHVRFKSTQAGILDALLAAQPEVKTDETFSRVLQEWRDFKGVEPKPAPESFVGTLRHYQNEALGWFGFLERFGFGGCLADDMGLGKTVQVLALLEGRRVARKKGRPAQLSAPMPSLVVVPRSLVFNWQQEAGRFTPNLRILTHTGAERTKGTSHFVDYDLIITTYGTLRRDALDFKNAQFDYVILDESQAIKNAKTESAKAVRLLKANYRLALSGTPIENHIGELWSLFEFLNPGILGGRSLFQQFTNSRTPNDETRTLLARALRPYILRRTKEQVAKELPKKLEQTIYCEMEAAQRKQYEELRDHYRRSLLERVEQTGISRAKIQILEALLRLRQAACHTALLAKDQEDAPSAKLDILLPRLMEVIEEGHKALVFSQFTSFLALVRRGLDHEGVSYEYLDGKTRDRGAKVARFQDDPECKLFLISLKAGGQGLNLTAADYVFLLDPWWNPAVEAQAIDRAHRIGQAKRVFAYRLITRETVEEKVLELQATKRELADAIINEDNSLIRNITGEELLLLLS